MRGSSAAANRSASRAPTSVHAALKAATATAPLRSFAPMQLMKYSPRPWMAKTYSVMTAPVNMDAMENATLTAVGIKELRSACLRMAFLRVSPLARAVRT